MTKLNENQRRRMLSSLRHLDHLLTVAEQIMAAPGTNPVFPRYLTDTTPSRCRVVEAAIERFRESLRGWLDELGLEPQPAETSMVRALVLQLIKAEIALEESGADALRGYGAVAPEAAAAVEAAAADLHRQLEAIVGLLDEAPDESGAAAADREG